MVFTLHAMEQKRLGRSCMYLPHPSQVPPNFDLVEGLASLDRCRGLRCTAFLPLILYVCQIKSQLIEVDIDLFISKLKRKLKAMRNH